MKDDYVITRELPATAYADAVRQVTGFLADEGFGILTEIDVRATIKKKLRLEFKPYVILGACNPSLAHRALTAEPMIGALLPCNVVVMERDGGGSVVAAFSPTAGFRMVDNPAVQPVAAEVEARLVRVLDRLAAG
jgi:uncharacterized protein (DUF302 family)